jgi:hypothetical protein
MSRLIKEIQQAKQIILLLRAIMEAVVRLKETLSFSGSDQVVNI